MYFKEIWRLCDAVFWFYVLSWRCERCMLWSCYCDDHPLSDIMEMIYLFFLKVCQSSIEKYMVCQYWTSVILINFQLLPYHYDFFCNEQNIQFLYVVIQNLKFSSSNWTHDEKWKCPCPLNRENFLKFQQVGVFFFPFSGRKVVLTRCRCYTRSILSKKKSWKRSLGILFFPNRGWITACLSLLLLVLCSDNLNLKFRFFIPIWMLCHSCSLSLG